MDRRNELGVPRDQLPWVLGQARLVRRAHARGKCLLCERGPINEAGLCEPCVATLGDEELRLVERWISGQGP